MRFLILMLLVPTLLFSAEAIPFLKPSFLNLKEDFEEAKKMASSFLSCSIRKAVPSVIR